MGIEKQKSVMLMDEMKGDNVNFETYKIARIGLEVVSLCIDNADTQSITYFIGKSMMLSALRSLEIRKKRNIP